MLRCSSADPMRRRIYEMKQRRMSDGAIVNTIVREEGIVALASPPAHGFGGVITWTMPVIALLAGFFIYSSFIRRNRKAPEPLSASDRAVMERFRTQIERELEEPSELPGGRGDQSK